LSDSDSRLDGVSGWLLAFIILSAISCAVQVVLSALTLFNTTDAVSLIEAAAGIALGLYGGHAIRLLSQRDPMGVQRAINWLSGLCVWVLIDATIRIALGLDLAGLGRPLAPSLAWILYLTKSRRVAVTYRAVST
jgi:hypothetical protein